MSPRTASAIIAANACLLIVTGACFCQLKQAEDTAKQLQRFKQLAAEAQPKVAAVMGCDQGDPISVAMVTRTQASRFVDSALAGECSELDLRKLGRCYCEIGLLPMGYDLEAELRNMLHEQAGAYYHPWSKTLTGIYGTVGLQDPSVEKMYLSHEMVHALQDRAMDLVRLMRDRDPDNDRQYCYRSVIEGMAGAVMVAFAMNKPLDSLPDMRSFWRSNLARMTSDTTTFKTLGRAPHYVREWLYSPYAEGGAFIQSWLRANPAARVYALCGAIPASGEQMLHFDKFQENDLPARIDLSRLRDHIGRQWRSYHANTLGEFELRTLFRSHPATRDSADDIAAGWDGCRFDAYADSEGRILMVGSSAWDSEDDAGQFERAFGQVLRTVRGAGGYTILRKRDRVHFVIGGAGEVAAQRLLASIR